MDSIGEMEESKEEKKQSEAFDLFKTLRAMMEGKGPSIDGFIPPARQMIANLVFIGRKGSGKSSLMRHFRNGYGEESKELVRRQPVVSAKHRVKHGDAMVLEYSYAKCFRERQEAELPRRDVLDLVYLWEVMPLNEYLP